MRKISFIVLAMLFSISSCPLFGQYFVTGIDPASLKWNQIKRVNGSRVIFPDYLNEKGFEVSAYLDTLTPYITKGLSNRVNNFPVVIHPTNVLSNGMVTWAPRRMELYSMPPTDIYAQSWIRQLVSHEYRHVVQLSNLNVGFSKAVSYILGEQILGLISMVPPSWFFEGDAVYAETQLSMFGRGWQPEFSIEYRAMLNEDEKYFKFDKWICGSLKDYVPNKYQLGYQVVSATTEYYGDDFWDKVIRYCGRNPYFIISPNIAYRKYEKTDSRAMIKRVFHEMKNFWEEASSVDNTSSVIETPITSYTTYTSPLYLDSEYIISVKKDLNRTSRLVCVNKSNPAERTLRYLGDITSRPILSGNKLYWTEYKPSLFWSQKSSSVVRTLCIDKDDNGVYQASFPKTVSISLKDESLFFITPVSQNRFAMVKYDRENNPSIIIADSSMNRLSEIKPLGNNVSFNGLAWDEVSGTLGAIIIDDDGLSLCDVNIDKLNIDTLLKPSYVTMKNLTAAGGKLYYNSIASGKDEVHCFDLIQNKEFRMTTSKYGSVYPSSNEEGDEIIMTTYSRKGYMLANQNIDKDSLIEVVPSKMPVNILNPKRKEWNTIKLDTVHLSSSSLPSAYTTKKYKKGGHLFNPHSWMPIMVNVPEILDERTFTIGAGVTVLSQNLMNTMISSLNYGWVNKSNYLAGSFKYTGLPVNLSLDVEYGGGTQDVYVRLDENSDHKGSDNYFKIGGGVSLPFNFSSGRNIRKLSLFANVNHYNSVLYNPDNNGTVVGMQKLTSGVSFSNYTTMSIKDLRYPLGYAIKVSGAFNPFNSNFGKLLDFYGAVYLPGIIKHHSLLLRGNVQYQSLELYNFRQKSIYPRGCYYSYAADKVYASSANYMFPLAYPDGGIPGTLYIKRISMSMFGEYARSQLAPHVGQSIPSMRNAYTYGGELFMDFNLLQIGVDLNLGVSVYKPNERDGVMCGLSFGFSL